MATRVLFVEFYERHPDAPRRRIPFAVVTEDAHGNRDAYDVAWCKRDGTFLYRDCGGGETYTTHDGAWWAAEGVEVTQHGKGPRLAVLPARFRGWPFAPSQSLDEGDESQFAWCSVCGTLPAVYPWDDEDGRDDDAEGADPYADAAPCPHLVWDRASEEWGERPVAAA